MDDDSRLEGDDEDHDEVIRAKWVMEGASSLNKPPPSCALWDHLESLEANGWQLTGEVQDDYGFMRP
jgi:hypothetical protein